MPSSALTDASVSNLTHELWHGNPSKWMKAEIMRELKSRGRIAPDGEPFVWGEDPIRDIHLIGEDYVIYETLTRRPGNAKPDWEQTVIFHPYVRRPKGADPKDHEWSDTHHSYHSLDEALIAAVIYRHEWHNSGINQAANERLTGYIMRILKEKS